MIVQAQWPHVLQVSLAMRDDDRAEVMATRWNDDPFDFAADCMRGPGAKLAAVDENGQTVAVGGVSSWTPGVAQAWLVGTDQIGRHGVEIAHACRASIKALFDSGDVHRVQAFSAATHKRAHRWLKAIGLHQESTLPAYGKAGEDFLIFSVLKGA